MIELILIVIILIAGVPMMFGGLTKERKKK